MECLRTTRCVPAGMGGAHRSWFWVGPHWSTKRGCDEIRKGSV